MRLHALMLASAAALSLTAAPAFAAQDAAQAPAEESMTEGEKLHALFDQSNEAELKLNPILALFRGDMRYADRLGDYLSDDYLEASEAQAAENLAALGRIDRLRLSATDALAYDVFKYNQERELAGYADDILSLNIVRPINHFSGFHTFYPTFASGKGAAPFKTVEDYENNLKRHAEFVGMLDDAIGRFREGVDSGVVETKLTITNVIEQLDTQLAAPADESPYYAPVTQFPEDFSEADKTRLEAEYREMVENEIYPAYRELRDFLKTEYLPHAREGVGLSYMKGGDRLYKFMIENTTTLPLEPDYIHNLGLSEVARIKGEMEKVREEVGFEGTLPEFFEYLRTDPKFQPESREWLTQAYYDIGHKVDERIAPLFGTLPETPLEIRPYEPFREKFQAGGSYQQGAPDGSRPGVFYFNAYNLPERLTPGMTTLYLHEGAPGHHFQISLAQENEDLPAFMRFGGNTAYVEGWALYSETLGYEMGMFDDPYQRFGTLNDEMLRAMRLVVDTGLHSKGWTRDQSIQYMLDNSGMTNTEATAEVERYIAIPSQALAYKIGALKIQELREKAANALGDDFSLADFHDQVLMTGSLPLPVLESKIDAWIASQKAE